MERLSEALGLKDVLRTGWVRAGVENPESVAAHSWGMALLAIAECPPELDRLRVLELCILHDLAEVVVGDLTPHDGVPKDEKAARERAAIQRFGPVAVAAFEEYEAQETAEAQYVKQLDKRDMHMMAEHYEAQGLDLSEFKQR